MDAGLDQNLESFFLLEYPQYELLFSISDPQDPSVLLVTHLIARYPQVSARLILGQIQVGPNPKVNNLIQVYGEAKYDCLLISDSNVRVSPCYLTNLAGHLNPDVGLITSIVSGINPSGVGGHLEAMFLNTYYARGMHLTHAVDHPCVMGKSMLFRRSVANRFGGIANLSRYLAEDHVAGSAMHYLGLKVRMATDPIPQHIGNSSFGSFWLRNVRWGRIRKSQEPIGFILEPYLGSVLSGVLGAWACDRLYHLSPGRVFCLHMVLWLVCDLAMMKSINVKVSFLTPLIWLAREALHLPLWLCVASGSQVTWRGRVIKLQAGGLIDLSEENDNSSWSWRHAKGYI